MLKDYLLLKNQTELIDRSGKSLSFFREMIIQKLFKKKIITQVHYIPAYKHPYYKKRIKGKFENAEIYYNTSLSLPIFPDLKIKQLKKICNSIKKICF